MLARTGPVLGVDVGGVIIQRVRGDADTSFFSSGYLNTPAVAGCVDALRALVESPFADNVHIVSKCGTRVADKTLEWFEHHDFYRLTGIKADHVHFTPTREGKAPICERFGVSHFVDDRLDVLLHLKTVPRRYLFVGGNPADERADEVPDGIRVIENWVALVALIQSCGG
jgi:hypothetical protein